MARAPCQIPRLHAPATRSEEGGRERRGESNKRHTLSLLVALNSVDGLAKKVLKF
jgi:hypothetical protein